MVGADLRQWQQVTRHLAQRREQYRDRIVGDPEVAAFNVERARLIESVGREAQRLVDGFDRQREAAILAEGARNAVRGRRGHRRRGARPRHHRHACRDHGRRRRHRPPARRRDGHPGAVRHSGAPAPGQGAAAQQGDDPARDAGQGAPSSSSSGRWRSASERVAEGIAPYSRFVRAEQQSLTGARDTLVQLRETLATLQSRVTALT